MLIAYSKDIEDNRLSTFLEGLKTALSALRLEPGLELQKQPEIIDFIPFMALDKSVYRKLDVDCEPASGTFSIDSRVHQNEAGGGRVAVRTHSDGLH